MLAKLIRYELYDLFKSKWMVGIFVFYLLLTYTLLYFGQDPTKAIISHNNIALITLPLFSLFLSAVYFYDNINFIEFILTQPVKRLSLFLSIFISLSLSLSIGFLLGSYLPFYYFLSFDLIYTKSLFTTALLVPLFVSLGLFLALLERDRLKGIGLLLLLWLFFSALYDSILLYFIITFSEYPLEKFFILFTLANPIDLIRLNLLMDTGLYEIIGFVGRWFIKYISYLFTLSLLVPVVYNLLFLTLGAVIFKRRDF
ncbi:MAG: NosY protein [Aquificaceae bacterium]